MAKNEKFALITGASTGIGCEYAKQLAAEGYGLVLVARSKDKLSSLSDDLTNKFGIESHVFVQDLAAKDAAQNIFAYTTKHNIGIDLLINNAGFGDVGKFLEHDIKEHLDMLNAMLMVIVELCHMYMPRMLELNSGGIINVSSVVGLMGTSLKMKVTRALYRPIKCFVIAFTEQLKVAYSDTNIKLQCLCPGLTISDFHKRVGQEDLYDKIPSFLWLSSAKVASISLKELAKGKKLVLVTGFVNKVGILLHRIASIFFWK